MKVKICGMRDPGNIAAVAALKPDYMGFIFFPGSKRFVGETFAPEVLRAIDPGISTVGVFVDAPIEAVVTVLKKYNLRTAQLHGFESADYCRELRERSPGVEIIKAVPVGVDGFEGVDPVSYEGACDYLLFDTSAPSHGGSGKVFDWNVLQKFSVPLPYFLSGGLGPDTIGEAMAQFGTGYNLEGFDLNSQVESAPGMKSVERIERVLEIVRR